MSDLRFSIGDLLYHSRRKLLLLWRRIAERAAVRVGGAIVALAMISAMVLFIIECEGPEDIEKWPYSTLFGTCRQVAILLFSGYDIQVPPQYTVSWGLMFFCLLLGIALLALLTADLATFLISAAMTGRGRIRLRLKNHVVICGWHYTAKSIVEQLTSREHKPRRKIVVVDEQVEDLRLLDPDIDYVRGDPTVQESLELARADRADVAIIPLDSSFSEDLQDSRITLATMAVKGMNPDIYTCVELLHPANRSHIQRTDADEVVCIGDFSQTLLSLSAVAHGLSRLFEDILTFNKGNEIHQVDLPSTLAGQTFRWLLGRMNEKLGCVLLAVRRAEHVHTNPQGEFKLAEGDRLFVLAEKPPTGLERLLR